MSRPTHEQLCQIALNLFGLRMVNGWTIPKCPARDFEKMQGFELENDVSHSDSHHWCELCQCRNYAGEGTKGEFWGTGEEWAKVGHFGVGFCSKHEKYLNDKRYKGREALLDFARRHRDAIMSRGPLSKQDGHAVAKHDAEASRRQLALVKNMEEMQKLTDEFLDFLKSSRKKDDNVILAAIKSLEDKLDDYDFNDEKTRKKYKEDLSDIILVASDLTEAAGGSIIPMTDKTKILLADKLMNSISKLNLDEYRMGKDSYVHVDEIRQRIPRILKLFKVSFKKVHEFHVKFDQEKDDMLRFLDDLEAECTDEHMKIWASMKTGSQ